MPRNGRCTGPRNPARARSRYAKAVDEAIRRAAADGTRTGNFHSNSPAVVGSVSTEAAVRFHRYRKGPCQRQVLPRETDFIVALLNLSELFFPNQTAAAKNGMNWRRQ